MCTSIWSSFFLTQCAIGVLDMFTFASAQNFSVRSTPAASVTPSTAFEMLDFWSGESLKYRPNMEWKNDKDCENNSTSKKTDGDKSLKKKDVKIGRRSKVSNSRSNDEKKKSTRFSQLDLEHTSHPPENSSAEKPTLQVRLNGYTLLQDITSIMDTIKEVNASVSVLAKTVEVHDIVLCKLTNVETRGKFFRTLDDKYVDEKPHKKIILIVHGLSVMGFRDVPCLYRKESFMKLVQLYAKHLDRFDIFLIPMGNPDGIADETRKLWNKNKAPLDRCSGVAVDRNFDVEWNRSHGINPCSQNYPGPAPFSEPESRAVADLIHFYNNRIVAYIHVHGATYNHKLFKGDAVLYPKGYTAENDYDQYNDIQAAIEEAMRNAGFKLYGVTVTSLYNWYGPVSGTSVDYATSVYGIPFGMEFVMQSYLDYLPTKTTSEEVHDNVLTEVWKRVIDVVFDVIYKSKEHSHESN